jgi:hypothetical protein
VNADDERMLSAAFADFVALDLGRWRGLPEAPLERWVAALRLEDEDLGRGVLGSARHLARWRPAEGADLRVWHRDGSVVLLELEPADKKLDLERLLGAPEARLATHAGFARLPQGECVWPARGLAAVVPEPGVVLRVLGFAACGLDEYLRDLRPEVTAPRVRREEGS